jgi:hypothetical protein
LCSLLKRTASLDPLPKAALLAEGHAMLGYANKACEIIADHFQHVLNDRSVGCCLRIAGEHDGGVVYDTWGRAGLHMNRGATTEAIGTAGIPAQFASRGNCGVFYVFDKTRAGAAGAYQLTKNDDLFKNDLKYVAVAPLNAWNGTEYGVIGLLFVGSMSKDVL